MSTLTVSLADKNGNPSQRHSAGCAEAEKVSVKLTAPYGPRSATLIIHPNFVEFSKLMAITTGPSLTFDLDSRPSHVVTAEGSDVRITLTGISGSPPFAAYTFQFERV